MMLASGAKPDLPDGNGRFPEEAARRSGASAELLRLLAAPPAANGRRARTVRPNGTNRHPRRPDPRPPQPHNEAILRYYNETVPCPAKTGYGTVSF